MKFFVYSPAILLTIILISCNNANDKSTTKDAELKTNDTLGKKVNGINSTFSDSIINNLQGEWREAEYPFRKAHFKNSTVKFIEEGVAADPEFVEYKISEDCPFEVNNIKNAVSNDLFLVIPASKRCEIIKVFKDSLTLSGFSTNTNRDYKIVYNRIKES